MRMAFKSIVKRILVPIGIVIGVIVLPSVGVVTYLLSPKGNEWLRLHLEHYLSEKLHTSVKIGGIHFRTFHHFTISNFSLLDPKGNNLINFKSISFEIRWAYWWGLKKSFLDDLRIERLKILIDRTAASKNFNYQFLLDAFDISGDKPDKSQPDIAWLVPGSIAFTNLQIGYSDAQTGDQASIISLNLAATLYLEDEAVPAKWILKSVVLDSTAIDIAVGATRKRVPSKSFEWDGLVTIGEFKALRSSLHYTSLAEQLEIQSDLRNIELIGANLSSAHKRFHVRRILVKDHFLKLRSQGPGLPNEKAPDPALSGNTAPLEIVVDTVIFAKNRFSADLKNHLRAPVHVFDPFHNDFQDVDFLATGLSYNAGKLTGTLSQLSFVDGRGFRLNSMKTHFDVTSKILRLDGLNINTPLNDIYGSIMWKYSSLEKAIADMEAAKFEITASANRLNLQEFSYFLPILLRYRNIYPLYKQNIRLNLQASGSPRNIRLSRMDVSTDHNFIQGNGEIHVPKRGNTSVIIDIKNGLSGKRGLLDVLSKQVLSNDLLEKIPEKIRLTSKLRITEETLQGNLSLNSVLGRISLRGSLAKYSNLSRVNYNLEFDTQNFNLASIVKDTLLGPITVRGRVRGTGLSTVNNMVLETEGYAQNMSLGGRQLQSVLFDGHLFRGRLTGNIASSDPYLNFELAPTLYFNQSDSLISVTGNMNHADLRKLGLSKDSLIVGGWISTDISKISEDSLIGTLNISSGNIRFGGKSVTLDHLGLQANHVSGQQTFQLKSELADVDVSGVLAIAEIPNFASGLSNTVLESKPFPTSTGVKSFQIQGNIHIPTELLGLTNSLSKVSAFGFTSAYDQEAGIFDFATSIDSLTANNIAADSVFLQLRTRQHDGASGTQTDYTMGFKNIVGPSVSLPNTQLSASVRDGIHMGALTSWETTRGSLLRIPFSYHTSQENPFLTLQDSLYFRGELWEASPDNRIYPFSKNLAGSTLNLKSRARSAEFTANRIGSDGLPYQLRLSKINLAPVSALIKADSTFLAGEVSGVISLNQFQPLTLTAKVYIDSLQVKGAVLGQLNAEVKSESANRYLLSMNVDNKGTILKAEGVYEPEDSAGTLSVDINSFPLTPFKELFENEIDSLRGNLNGHFNIGLIGQKASINGVIRIDSTTFSIKDTGTRIHIADGGVAVDGDKINVEPIVLRDGAGGQAIITGSIDITNNQNPHYKLKLDAKRFRTIDVLRRREQLVYGNAKTDANLDLSGDLNTLRLNGQVSLIDSSQIFYRSAAASRPDFGEGLLDFVVPNENLLGQKTLSANTIGRLINTNISVPSNATLTLLLDEYRGEKVVVRGKSSLNYSQHAGGETQLNGKYEVTSGTYTFSVGNNIRKEFTLENGGTIQWMGDLYQPVCDLTAVYKVNTSAAALLQGSDANSEAGRRKFDFLVKLKLKGNLSKPEITFEIGMNDTDQDAFDGVVYSKIKQINNSQSDATKQVMSLLVLNSFMGDSPFGSLSQFSANSLEAGAYNTIGNLLTRQLNSMLAGMVKAVDITLGVNWSQSMDAGRSSTRSDIKLGIGKSLFNHRLNLYVGNNFGVETLSGTNSGISGLANDVSIEYLLNPEGKYRIKGYHVRDNDLTLHGEHMETGVKFAIIWEFNQQEAKRIHKKNRR